jgi:hypothetical protein
VRNHSTVILYIKKQQRRMVTFIFSIVSQMLLLLPCTSFSSTTLPLNIHSHNIWDVKSRQTLSTQEAASFSLPHLKSFSYNQPVSKLEMPCQDTITTTCLSHHPFTFCVYSYVSCMLLQFFSSLLIDPSTCTQPTN